jgi:putative hemolysin
MNVADLNEQLPIGLPAGEYDTVAGYLLHALGRIPQPGDAVQHGGYTIRVEQLEDNRVKLLRIVSPRRSSTIQRSALRFPPNADSPEPIPEPGESNQESAVSRATGPR